MKRTALAISATFLAGLLGTTPAAAVIVPLAQGVSFQDDDGIGWSLFTDDTAKLGNDDGVWAPTPPAGAGVVGVDYYATGTAGNYYDAASLKFDLSGLGYQNVASARLEFDLQKGTYVDTNWEHYKVLQGAFNPAYQDVAYDGATDPVDFGGAGVLANNAFVGWLAWDIPLAWITSDILDVTLRLWNARIDAVRLDVSLLPEPPGPGIPEPAALALFGLGLAGMAYARRRKALA
jgi:hypothetical protein